MMSLNAFIMMFVEFNLTTFKCSDEMAILHEFDLHTLLDC